MQDRRPAPLNVVPEDATGTTWALLEGAIARFGKGGVGDVKLSPDGTYFVVASGVGLWWYDVSSMLPISLWETERGLISSVDFSHDSKWIVIGSWDQVIKVLDVQTGDCVTQLEGQDAFAGLACSSNSKWFATAVMNGVVKVLDIHSGDCIAQMDRGAHEFQTNDISQLEFSPDGRFLAATVENSELYSDDDQLLNPDTEGTQTYVWHPETGEAIVKFAGRNFVFSPDSRLLTGAAFDETLGSTDRVDRCVSVWDVTTVERISHFSAHTDLVENITFSPCGEFLVSSSRDKSLRVWDLADGVEKKVYTNSETDWGLPFYSPEGQLLTAVFRYEKTTVAIDICRVESGEKLQTIELLRGSVGAMWFFRCPQLAGAYALSNKRTDGKTQTFPALCEPHFPWPYPKVAWLDNQTLVSTRDYPGIELWDVAQKCPRETLLKDENIYTYTVLPCGRILGTRLRNETKVWDASNPDEPVAEFTAPKEPSEWVRHEIFAPTGDRLAAGSREGTVYVWNFQTPEEPTRLTGHTDYVQSLAFSPDGKRLVSGAHDNTTRLWDIESGEQIATLPMDEPRTTMGIAFSPCGNIIAGGMDDEIRLWCADQLTTLRKIPQPENSRRTYDALAFSPCGEYLASGTWWQQGMEKMAIRLWEVETGENIHTFWGHTTDVQSLDFSPDSTLLASGSFDGTILLWDVKPFIGS